MLSLYRADTVVYRLRLHNEPGAAAVRLVVNVAVLVLGVEPDIVCIDLYKPVLYPASENTCA